MRGCGCAHSDKSQAGIGLLLSQAEEEKLHPISSSGKKKKDEFSFVSLVQIRPTIQWSWSRAAAATGPRVHRCQHCANHSNISPLASPPSVPPSLQGSPATGPRTQHRGVNTQCWGHPPPCSNPEGDLGDAREEEERGRAYLHRLLHEKEGLPPWPAPLSPGPCCVPPSPACLSKLILVKMSP